MLPSKDSAGTALRKHFLEGGEDTPQSYKDFCTATGFHIARKTYRKSYAMSLTGGEWWGPRMTGKPAAPKTVEPKTVEPKKSPRASVDSGLYKVLYRSDFKEILPLVTEILRGEKTPMYIAEFSNPYCFEIRIPQEAR